MAFNDQRRYGHIPPVQYPVQGSNQQQQSQDGLSSYGRRSSFNNGDDAAFFDTGNGQGNGIRRGEDELFLTHPDPSTTANTGATNTSRPGSYGMAGYQPNPYPQQQAPTPSTYNPAQFASQQVATSGFGRSQSTSQVPTGAARYGTTPTSPTFQQSPSSYTPQAYNPAAYANTNAPPQRQATYHGYNHYAGSYNSAALPQPPLGQAQIPSTPSTTHSAGFSPQLPQHQLPPAQSSYMSSLPSPPYGASNSLTNSTMSTPYESSSSFPAPYPATPNYFSGSYATNGAGVGGASAATPPSASTTGASPYPSQIPYPTTNQIPVGPAYSPNYPTDNSLYGRSRSSSQVSPLPSPAVGPQQSGTSLQRHPTNAPLPNRPMEDVPEEQDWDPSTAAPGSRPENSDLTLQNNLMQEIEADLGLSDPEARADPRSHTQTHGHRPRPVNGNLPRDHLDHLRRYDTDSDPEGAFGVYSMREALADDHRFSAHPTPAGYTPAETAAATQPPLPPLPSLAAPVEDQGGVSDNEFAGVDLGFFGGGYAGTLSYDNNVGSPPAIASEVNDLGASESGQGRPLPYPDADIDYGGTGGLQMPTRPRSFDGDGDGDGDEDASVHSRRSGSSSPFKDDDYPDMFYHPGLSNRPLPAIPPTSDSASMLSVGQPAHQSQAAVPGRPLGHTYSHSGDSRLEAAYMQAAEAAQTQHLQQPHQQHLQQHNLYPQQQQNQVERSISLSSHSNTPQIQIPGRSRTDAAEERRKAQRHQAQAGGQAGLAHDAYDTGTPSSMAFDNITLPTGRKRKFYPAKLGASDIRRCAEPWALSGIAAWIREMAEGEPDLKLKTIEDGLVKLFCSKVPTMNVADAETLATNAVASMLEAGILVPEEEWVKFGTGSISGVLWQLTGSGCYAPKLHEQHEAPGRCYSYHCTRTLKKANLGDLMSEQSVKKVEWAEYYGVTKEVMETKNKKEIARQNNLHEIIYSEELYVSQLEVLRVLYKEQLRAWQPPIIAPNRLDKFIENVFGKVELVQQTNKDNLLAQLKYRQIEQGPWVVGFSDIFREWIRKAREPYIAYSASYPYADYSVRREGNRNVLFRQFLEHVRTHKRSEKLAWDHFIKAPITRLQRYSLLLQTVYNNSHRDDEEKANLATAIEEIKKVTMECDKLVDEMAKKVKLIELQSSLIIRPGFESGLNLDHLGRVLKKQGELQRMGSKGMKFTDTYALLFDHYFILAKVVSRDSKSENRKYDVSKEPIPMPLLFLESMADDPISKQRTGLTAPLVRTTAVTGSGTQLNKVVSNGGRPGLEHSATTSSVNTTVSRISTNTAVGDESKIVYPFRVKHLGHEVYTLYAATAQERQDWCQNIIEAKTFHARALHAQNAEPFRLRVLADSAFAYDSISAIGKSSGIPIRGTPLDRAIREMEKVYGAGRTPNPVCRAQVNCSTAFTAFGRSLIAIGTDSGIYVSEASNPRGWQRTVLTNRVTQIAVLEEFSVCLVIADKSLVSYPLDVVAPPSSYPAPVHDNPRRAPVRLAKDVSFFSAARMKDRMLVFFKRKESLHTVFKVLEPVFQKSAEKKTRFFGSRRGTGGGSGSSSTDYFRDFDEFYLPTECYGLNPLQTWIGVATAKGFEMLTLDRKQTMSVPRDVTEPAIADIAARIRDQRPLGMFKLNDQEFLLTYEDCAVYMDKHGEVSRTLIMEYSGKQKKAKAATMFGQFLLLFNEDYVEVRNAENGRLRQIIAGRDVRCLDYGHRGPTGGTVNNALAPGSAGGAAGVGPSGSQFGSDSKGTVKICMSHPEVAGQQIVLEMLLNDGHLEKT